MVAITEKKKSNKLGHQTALAIEGRVRNKAEDLTF